MAGGKGKIKPEDNPKPWVKGRVPHNYTWTEAKILEVLDDLEQWLLEEEEIFDDKKQKFIIVDAGNCFFKEFLYKRGLMDSWISRYTDRFTTVRERIADIQRLQEFKLQLLAATGKQKEGITKFILQNKHGWAEKTENKNENNNINWNEVRTYQDKKNDE